MAMKAIFKYNGGLGALLCSKCRVIIKTGKYFTDDEWKSIRGELDMPAQYCETCMQEMQGDKTSDRVL